MEYIAHRINTVAELKETPVEFGVELDLRDSGNELILQHDPFSGGERFEDYLAEYQHGTMILNIKSERIEHRVLELVKQYGIKNYFFLDSSFPMIYSLSSQLQERKVALRFSEFEGLDTILTMQGRVDWVWVDCFSRLPITRENCRLLKEAGFKLCLVSPELQAQADKISDYKNYLAENSIIFDAICTKKHNVDLWKS